MKKRNKAAFLAVCLISCFSAGVAASSFEADYIPWSGYWWPFQTGGLVTGKDYRGLPAPLEKYDYIVEGRYNGAATAYGKGYYYDEDAVSWAGLCFSWAASAIMEEEPVHRGIYKDVVLNIGDKKGILAAAYDGVLVNFFVIDSPVVFHQLLVEYLTYQKTPFILDLHTHGEVWNYPVFRYETEYQQDGNIRHYTTWIYYISDSVHPDYTGISSLSAMYQYYFEVDANGNIIDSGWEKGSENNHPASAGEPLAVNPKNSGMNYDDVLRVVSIVDDPYEENDTMETPAALSGGHYTLLSIDRDYFSLSMQAGDGVTIRIDVENEEELEFNIWSPEGGLLRRSTGADLRFSAEIQGSYILEVLPAEGEEIVYELFVTYDLSHQKLYPCYPAGAWSNEISFLNTSQEAGRVLISLCDREGKSRSVYSADAPAVFTEGRMEEDFALISSRKGYIRIDSDMPLEGTVISSYGDYLMAGAGLLSSDNGASVIHYPHIAVDADWKTYFGLINIGTQTETLSRHVYDEGGNVLGSDGITLSPGQAMEENVRNMDIWAAGAASMSAELDIPRRTLLGYIRFHNPAFGARGRCVIPLPNDIGPELTLPHIAADDYWWTGLAMMNTGESGSEVLFSAHAADGSLLARVSRDLRAKGTLVCLPHQLFPVFPDNLNAPIASLHIVSANGQPLTGIALYGSSGEQLQLAGMPLQATHPTSAVMSFLSSDSLWWTGIGLVNTGDGASEFSFSLLDPEGNEIGAYSEFLHPDQQSLFTLRNAFGENAAAGAAWLKLDTRPEESFSGVWLIGSRNGLRLMGDAIR
ncbi:MAG: hypothetical protein CSB33_03605 [Desulfobacterales bacterium]|nr:MAG: hypothetical protein CSB33_03605 [Desulfobacterales bacterium]